MDKPERLSSNAALDVLKRKLKIKKMGHSGTLDPFATGLLFVAVGEGTKFLPYVMTEPKEYIAALKLGTTTDTLDPQGRITETRAVLPFHEKDLQKARESLLGRRPQLAPAFSAKKVDGERAYDLARRGEKVERKSCEVTIHELDFTEANPDHLVFRALCSTGTYVRVLGEEIADRLDTVGHLTSLRRTQMGCFHVDQAVTLEAASQACIQPISKALDYPQLELSPEEHKDIQLGKTLKKECGSCGIVKLSYLGCFVGLGEAQTGQIRPIRLIRPIESENRT